MRATRLDRVIEVRNQVLMTRPDRPESVEFHLTKHYLGSSLTPDPKRTKETVAVPTAAFSDLRGELRPDVLLMDIEGGELEFLDHADLSGVRGLVIEFHPNVYDRPGMRRCKALLRAAGFAPIEELSSRLVWVAAREG